MARVLFLQSIRYDYIGTMMLSACLKRSGHECGVAFGNSIGDFRRRILREAPEIIAFSLMSGLHLWANEMTRQIRRLPLLRRPYVIYGGPHPTFFPDILETSDADAICVGEGEQAIVELADCIDRGEPPTAVSNLHVKVDGRIVANPVRPLLTDLDALPFPDREIYYRSRFFRWNPTKTFMAGRGCPFNCTFCYNKSMRDIYSGKGRFVRLRTPGNVIEEILHVKSRWGLKTVMFFDDTFGLDKSWTMQLMDLFKRDVRLPFLCRIRANCVDEEMIAAFKNAGCAAAFFAIETANEEMRQMVLRKALSNADIYRTAQWLRQYGIKFFTYNMVGIPGERIEDIYATMDMNIKIGTSYPWCSIFSPYPGTELAERCIAQGRLRSDFHPDHLTTTYHRAVAVNAANADEAGNLHKFFQLGVLCPRLVPVIRRLSKLKPNALFVAVFSLVYFINYIRSERLSAARTLVLAWHNMKEILGVERPG